MYYKYILKICIYHEQNKFPRDILMMDRTNRCSFVRCTLLVTVRPGQRGRGQTRWSVRVIYRLLVYKQALQYLSLSNEFTAYILCDLHIVVHDVLVQLKRNLFYFVYKLLIQSQKFAFQQHKTSLQY